MKMKYYVCFHNFWRRNIKFVIFEEYVCFAQGHGPWSSLVFCPSVTQTDIQWMVHITHTDLYTKFLFSREKGRKKVHTTHRLETSIRSISISHLLLSTLLYSSRDINWGWNSKTHTQKGNFGTQKRMVIEDIITTTNVVQWNWGSQHQCITSGFF